MNGTLISADNSWALFAVLAYYAKELAQMIREGEIG